MQTQHSDFQGTFQLNCLQIRRALPIREGSDGDMSRLYKKTTNPTFTTLCAHAPAVETDKGDCNSSPYYPEQRTRILASGGLAICQREGGIYSEIRVSTI
jgi:hypothetical protein